MPGIREKAFQALGKREGWEIELDEYDSDRQTILFHYPKTFDYIGGYIKPSIRLEFGARGEGEPSQLRSIQPYVAEIFPQLFTQRSVEVPTLSVERTFWEKVTILHALYHNLKQPNRLSRHYYDTYELAQKGIASSALQNPSLLEQVVRNKTLMFKEPGASYHMAQIGTLRLVPNEGLLPALKKDYKAMTEMFMGEAPPFDKLMASLNELETLINKPIHLKK